MSFHKGTYSQPSHFYLNKWYLDFIGKNGAAMIFYSAELKWHGLRIPYSSWLNCDKNGNVTQKSRFRNPELPKRENDVLSWNDTSFGVKGTWQSAATPVSAKIIESNNGGLDWNCYQPASEVNLEIDGEVIAGKGYAEQLVLTIPVWKIPMDKLRWGRVGSKNYQLVWIEIVEKEKKQWFWLNGKRIYNCEIGDDLLVLSDMDISIKLDRGVVFESEKKILSVVEKLVKYIPGLKKHIPQNFLLADESKWLSKAVIIKGSKIIDQGVAIHEYVNFKTLAE